MRPTVDDLLTTVFSGGEGEMDRDITECLENAGEYYSPELHLLSLKERLGMLVGVICDSKNSEWPIISHKVEILKAIEMLNMSIGKTALL